MRSTEEVQLKLRFATDFLGSKPARTALSPRLLFHSSVPNRIGPRFAFVKARGVAAGLAPATLLKGTDEARPVPRCHSAWWGRAWAWLAASFGAAVWECWCH